MYIASAEIREIVRSLEKVNRNEPFDNRLNYFHFENSRKSNTEYEIILKLRHVYTIRINSQQTLERIRLSISYFSKECSIPIYFTTW